MLILAVITVFVGGLMVRRTPEYVGKKSRPREMKYAGSWRRGCRFLQSCSAPWAR